jgi:hypothetical protein
MNVLITASNLPAAESIAPVSLLHCTFVEKLFPAA